MITDTSQVKISRWQKKHIKMSCSASLFISRLEVKTMRFQQAGRDAEPRPLTHSWWECRTQPFWKTPGSPREVLLQDPVIVPLGIFPTVGEPRSWENLHVTAYRSFIHRHWKLGTTQTSQQAMDKLWHPVEYYSVIKRNEVSSQGKSERKLSCNA